MNYLKFCCSTIIIIVLCVFYVNIVYNSNGYVIDDDILITTGISLRAAFTNNIDIVDVFTALFTLGADNVVYRDNIKFQHVYTDEINNAIDLLISVRVKSCGDNLFFVENGSTFKGVRCTTQASNVTSIHRDVGEIETYTLFLEYTLDSYQDRFSEITIPGDELIDRETTLYAEKTVFEREFRYAHQFKSKLLDGLVDTFRVLPSIFEPLVIDNCGGRECSYRGVCNPNSGKCECYDSFTTTFDCSDETTDFKNAYPIQHLESSCIIPGQRFGLFYTINYNDCLHRCIDEYLCLGYEYAHDLQQCRIFIDSNQDFLFEISDGYYPYDIISAKHDKDELISYVPNVAGYICVILDNTPPPTISPPPTPSPTIDWLDISSPVDIKIKLRGNYDIPISISELMDTLDDLGGDSVFYREIIEFRHSNGFGELSFSEIMRYARYVSCGDNIVNIDNGGTHNGVSCTTYSVNGEIDILTDNTYKYLMYIDYTSSGYTNRYGSISVELSTIFNIESLIYIDKRISDTSPREDWVYFTELSSNLGTHFQVNPTHFDPIISDICGDRQCSHRGVCNPSSGLCECYDISDESSDCSKNLDDVSGVNIIEHIGSECVSTGHRYGVIYKINFNECRRRCIDEDVCSAFGYYSEYKYCRIFIEGDDDFIFEETNDIQYPYDSDTAKHGTGK